MVNVVCFIEERIRANLVCDYFIAMLCERLFEEPYYWINFEEDTHNRAYLNDCDDTIVEYMNERILPLLEEMIISKKEWLSMLKYLLDDVFDDDTYDTFITAYQESNWRYLTSMYIDTLTRNLVNEYQYDIHLDILGNAEEYKEKQEHEQLVIATSKKIAIKKIIRNKIYYCGLAKKLSMRDCGMFNQST